MSEAYKIIDLSLPIETTNQEFIRPKVKFISHKKGAKLLCLGGLIDEKSFIKTIFNFSLYILGIKKITHNDFPDGMALAWEEVRMETHTGTHMDAPWHFGPYSEELPAKTIDRVPLEWCYADGVVLDMRHKQPNSSIEAVDLEKACNEIRYKIKEKEIVLIMTGADKYSSQRRYLFQYPALTKEATLWLLNQGVKIIGTDSWGFDAPFKNMISDYSKSKDRKYLWPNHFVGRDKEYCHIEKLVNLDKIPVPFGFKVACFPINLSGASSGWIRAVAILQ